MRDRQPVRVADIGAGTGKLTTKLAGLGAEVTAVEPDPQMLAEPAAGDAAEAFGAGERRADPAPDASLDAALAGQATHWFDMDRAPPESPGCSGRAACSPGCGTWTTTGSAGWPGWPRSASESPASR